MIERIDLFRAVADHRTDEVVVMTMTATLQWPLVSDHELDFDFLDTSGYAVLPVESAPLPIDARPAVGDARPLEALLVTQSLDERRAGEGILALEIQAQARGLLPPLDELLDMEGLDPAFEVVSVEDPGLGAEELDLEAEELAVVSARRWLIELRGKAGLEALLYAPAAPSSQSRPEPDWPGVHRELRKPGVRSCNQASSESFGVSVG